MIPNLENSWGGKQKWDRKAGEKPREILWRCITSVQQSSVLSGTQGSLSFRSHHELIIPKG